MRLRRGSESWAINAPDLEQTVGIGERYGNQKRRSMAANQIGTQGSAPLGLGNKRVVETAACHNIIDLAILQDLRRIVRGARSKNMMIGDNRVGDAVIRRRQDIVLCERHDVGAKIDARRD